MTFAGLNWLAVLASSVAAFVAGGLWFSPKTFFPLWWKAMGRKEGENPAAGMNMGLVFGSTFAGQFAQATAMAVLVSLARRAAGGDAFGAAQGALVGLVVGSGIAAASSLSHRLFSGHGYKVWLIEVSSDVVNLTLMGAILAAWP
jgi:hypothetical protein